MRAASLIQAQIGEQERGFSALVAVVGHDGVHAGTGGITEGDSPAANDAQGAVQRGVSGDPDPREFPKLIRFVGF